MWPNGSDMAALNMSTIEYSSAVVVVPDEEVEQNNYARYQAKRLASWPPAQTNLHPATLAASSPYS